MPSFEKSFMESKGQPVEYKGNKICLADKFPIKNAEKLIINIENIDLAP